MLKPGFAEKILRMLELLNLKTVPIRSRRPIRPVSLEPGPKTGIFWIDGNHIVVAEICDLIHSRKMGSGTIGSFSTHPAEWEHILEMKPEWKAKTWRQVPRGRVLFSNGEDGGIFIVFMPPEADGNRELLNEVLETFSIPAGQVSWQFSYDTT